ncbi:MAG TPA: metallophosphoesterase [Chitinophagaceae bacterium]|nr:metallophosphoesterase [Chitinophagaceae bacterium]
MKANFITSNLLAVLLMLTAAKDLKADTTYIKFGSTWKFLDNGTAAPAGSGAADWRNIAFNDASWNSGPAELGYGDAKERTTVSYGGNPSSKYITTYFRQGVNINPGLYSGIRLNTYLDDGAVIYINGTEVARSNMNAGTPLHTTLATAAAPENGNVITTIDIPATAFVSGNNMIAVEVHQNAANSSDLVFDLELAGITGTGEPATSRGPLLQMVNSNAVTIRWTTATATTSRIEYGSSENSLTATLSDNTSVTEHEMRITGLTPDTKYYYAVGSVTSIVKGSYRNYFTTAPPASTTRKIRIGVFGDPGKGDANQKSTRDAYIDLKNGYNNSELAIMLGDNAYNAGLQTEHQTNFFDIYNDNIFTNHVIMPVPGNHEYANDASAAGAGNLRWNLNIPYYSVFTLPAAGESGGVASGTEQYYSANYGNIHFIMLDTYGYSPDPTDPTNFTKHTRLFDDTTNGAQAKWLKQDLAANAGTHKWTIVCMHHPPYTNGSHASDSETDLMAIRQKITPILEQYGVDIVLAGHSHVYERSFLVKDHTGLSSPFNTAVPGAGTQISTSSARYDGTAGNLASADFNAATTSCPYFTIDSVFKHGTVYVVAGSAGQIGGATNAKFPVWYYKNYSGSTGGEVGALSLEVQDNRLDAKFVGAGGTVRDQFTIMKGVNKKTIVNTSVNNPTTLTASWVGGYNWYTTPFPPVTNQGTGRTLAVTPVATGSFTYYVNDSLSPKTTCIADTFMLQVTSALAVAVTTYTASLKNKKVLVDWTTSQEVNSDYFTVERSANGRDYEMIMVISGKGNAVSPTNYEFIDNDPLPGTSYYRLIATDKDGDKKIVGIRSVNNNAVKLFSIAVQPNPALNNEVNTVIQSIKKQMVKVKVYNASGAEVYSTQIQARAGNTALRFNLPSGIYVVSAETQDSIKMNEKILVK